MLRSCLLIQAVVHPAIRNSEGVVSVFLFVLIFFNKKICLDSCKSRRYFILSSFNAREV
jgi:hypothetical protein